MGAIPSQKRLPPTSLAGAGTVFRGPITSPPSRKRPSPRRGPARPPGGGKRAGRREKRRAAVPGHARGIRRDVVPLPGRDGDDIRRDDPDGPEEPADLLLDFEEPYPAVPHQVELVDRHHHLRQGPQGDDVGVAPRLLPNPLGAVHQEDRRVRGPPRRGAAITAPPL